MGMHDAENNPMKKAHPVHYDCALRLSLSLEPCAGSRRLAPVKECQSANVASILSRRTGLTGELEDLFESAMVHKIHPEASIHPDLPPVGCTKRHARIPGHASISANRAADKAATPAARAALGSAAAHRTGTLPFL